ncbi:MAG: hypothetical protein KME19_21970 [Microcoleus vaginatus WJT46-NPBG5]|nr:hypothetical protein [Microcoleus vaginatus WJT46-NPBG5]
MPELKDEWVCRQPHSLGFRTPLSAYPRVIADRINQQDHISVITLSTNFKNYAAYYQGLPIIVKPAQ